MQAFEQLKDNLFDSSICSNSVYKFEEGMRNIAAFQDEEEADTMPPSQRISKDRYINPLVTEMESPFCA